MAVAITKPAPLMKEVQKGSRLVDDTAYLRNEDEVRIVCVDESVIDIDKSRAMQPIAATSGDADLDWSDPRGHKRQKLTCLYRGIDFKHFSNENGVSELGVQLRFTKVKGSDDVVRMVQHGGVAVDADEDELPIELNDCFKYEDKHYHVKVIRRNGVVICEEVVSGKTKVFLPYHQVSNLVDAYYNISEAIE